MKMIILAAGQGTRLRPLTDDKPKCMVEYRGKPLIDYILETAKSCDIGKIALVTGYRSEVLANHLKSRGIKFYNNDRFARMNMVASLFTALPEIDGSDDVIISYSDIIYNKEVLSSLVDEQADFSVVVDLEWVKLWKLRMDDPLVDAETMKLDGNGCIIELGKKAATLEDIKGQYIGLIKIRASSASKIADFYLNVLDRKAIYDGKDFDNMYMTSFIQEIIGNLMPAKAVFIRGGWLEIDTLEDLERYTEAGFNPVSNSQ